MRNIQIVATGAYIPNQKVANEIIEKKFNLDRDFIYKRTGIKSRNYVQDEKIEYIATIAVKNLLEKNNINSEIIDMIIVATTSTNKLMPGISYEIQKNLKLKKCICLDILAGCAGYINAFDIARSYIAIGKVNNAIVVGVDILSEYTTNSDIGTSILFADGAGATLISKTEKEKKYYSYIESDGINGDILVCDINNKKIKMNGKEIYKYAVTQTVQNAQELLIQSNNKIENIKYIVPHQSNLKMLKSIASRLEVDVNKIYINIENVGNTFCASIPIALNEMFENKLIKENDNILLIGYGGGLNTGSILLEI